MTTPGSQWSAGRVASLAARSLARLVLFVVLAAIIGAMTVLLVLPRATGANPLTVLTGSMTPEIPVGSIVMVRPVDTGTLRVGDVATYQKEPDVEAYITHRIVKINQTFEAESSTPVTSFIFKGDANNGRDFDPVPAEAIMGEVWFHVPYLGSIRDALNGVAGLSLLAMLVLGGYALSQVGSAIRDKRRLGTEDRGVAIECDRALLLAEIPTASVYGTPPSEAATEWGGILLRQEESSFTVLFAPEPWDVASMLRDLQLFDPTSVEVLEAPTPVNIHLDEHEAKVWDTVPVGPKGGQNHATT